MFGLGRPVGTESKSSLASSIEDSFASSVFITRPKNVSNKCGTTGKEVSLSANYFEVEQLPDFELTQYHVDFEPSLDIAKIRNAFIAKEKPILGGEFYFFLCFCLQS